MPEAGDSLPGGGTGDMALGFGIRRGCYAAPPRNGRLRSLSRYPSDNKDNTPLESSSSRRRRTRPSRSPLPSWYPRTPLRDITAVVNAMERRRNRLRAAAECRRRNQESGNSSPFPLPTSPLSLELNVSEQTLPPIQDQKPALTASDFSPDPSLVRIKNSFHSAEHPPNEISPTETMPALDEKTVATSKIFSDSIDEIEKIVMDNLQKMAKKTTGKSDRSNLISMR